MHFLENSIFFLNAYFCHELRFVATLRSKLRFLLRKTGVDSEFLRKNLAAEVSGLAKCLTKCYHFTVYVSLIKLNLRNVQEYLAITWNSIITQTN